ncbi:MAG: hypothetical protein KDD32_08540 [Bacteroidetes bacterium]|nr:hypothetical protein [Bacteroidota bacterium]
MKTSPLKISLGHFFAYSLVTISLLLSSCSSIDVVDELQPISNTTERVDFNINGDIIKSIHIENEDLSSYTKRTEPIVNDGEHLVRINIDENSFIDLTLYQKYFSHPLENLYQYGAFAHNLLSSKPAYLVADYYIDGKRTYCSAPSYLENTQQFNVFRATEHNNQYLVRVENLKLYDVLVKRTTAEENYIQIYGTFTLLK